ncbi:hypothetical protein P8452_26252 [Trifolium repens]|nr:hypothetical protein P8452_26252 [Trifolium repens]
MPLTFQIMPHMLKSSTFLSKKSIDLFNLLSCNLSSSSTPPLFIGRATAVLCLRCHPACCRRDYSATDPSNMVVGSRPHRAILPLMVRWRYKRLWEAPCGVVVEEVHRGYVRRRS